jgi:hypothetical protein
MPPSRRLGTSLIFAIVALIAFAETRAAMARDDRTAILSFEGCGGARCLEAWNGKPGGPAGTVHIDSTAVHGGRYAGRIERAAGEASRFSSLAIEIPVDFTGKVLELRGWLRLEGVTGPAGLWQRQQGRDVVLQFDNMDSRPVTGTHEWQEFRISLPLDSRAINVTVGALMRGQGRLWVDDLSLWVDGRPLAEAPQRVQPKTVFDTDHEFDHGSNIASAHLSRNGIENLSLLAKTWGFLKYHHPAAVQGRIHWDYELFRILPAVLAAPDRETNRFELSRWITRLGPVPPCSMCASSPKGRPLEPPLAWLSDRALLGDTLSAQLLEIYARRPALTDQFYVSMVPGVGNPDFSNEAAYRDSLVPDPGYRLLALFRFWNIVQYWSPYRDVAGEDWDRVLREYIPRLFTSGTRLEYEQTMMQLFARLHDGHANVWSAVDSRPPRGTCRVAAPLRFLGDTLVVGAMSDGRGLANALRPGDIIRTIDDAPVDSLVRIWASYYGASNDAARRREIASFITRGACDSVKLAIVRAGRARTISAPRVQVPDVGETHDHPGETFRRLSEDLAYLKLSSIKTADVPEYLRRAAGARLLVIDIRNYPAEFVVFALGQHLVASPTPFTRFTTGDLSNPGSFQWTDSLLLVPQAPRFEGRVAILVDETSQSQAEYTTMALRAAPGAVVVGSMTAGADGNVSAVPLPGGMRGLISGIGVFYPDRTPTQRIGIRPDRTVRPTVAGLAAGRDEVMEDAVRGILGRAMSDAERAAWNDGTARR